MITEATLLWSFATTMGKQLVASPIILGNLTRLESLYVIAGESLSYSRLIPWKNMFLRAIMTWYIAMPSMAPLLGEGMTCILLTSAGAVVSRLQTFPQRTIERESPNGSSIWWIIENYQVSQRVIFSGFLNMRFFKCGINDKLFFISKCHFIHIFSL